MKTSHLLRFSAAAWAWLALRCLADARSWDVALVTWAVVLALGCNTFAVLCWRQPALTARRHEEVAGWAEEFRAGHAGRVGRWSRLYRNAVRLALMDTRLGVACAAAECEAQGQDACTHLLFAGMEVAEAERALKHALSSGAGTHVPAGSMTPAAGLAKTGPGPCALGEGAEVHAGQEVRA